MPSVNANKKSPANAELFINYPYLTYFTMLYANSLFLLLNTTL